VLLLLRRVDLDGGGLIGDSLLLLSNKLFSRFKEDEDDDEEESSSYSMDSSFLD